ncbi:stage II sporulation protein M [Aneurinibacillus sp. Ricciae_BoGa-3]|uniref:stage II sporulation protein M n=1 Tax=Aneurinibacillus sp. Ricciae_BoGa-3 TaxID=3022697 RepID=UPI002340FB0F|nr:stage II sporulation protein M [Aneurinibacillus sp. Ricciae_BoGa-3]WCK54800.1 stage II sporulation protein M [Aneurinibacillus sp. Ricciae_BoGa-3]
MLKRLGGIIRDNKGYISLGFALMVIGVLIGYVSADIIKHIASNLFRGIDRIARDIEHVQSPLYTFWVLFKNNLMAAVSMLGLGIFLFGIYPAFGLLVNGIILGFLLRVYANIGINPLKIFVLGILPHGIFELSAIILAASIGIKLGVIMYQWFLSLFVQERRKAASSRFSKLLRDLPVIVGAIVVMLFIAAIIESTVTPALIKSGMGGEQVKIIKNIISK